MQDVGNLICQGRNPHTVSAWYERYWAVISFGHISRYIFNLRASCWKLWQSAICSDDSALQSAGVAATEHCRALHHPRASKRRLCLGNWAMAGGFFGCQGSPPAYLLQQLRIFTVHADWPNLEWSANSDELSGFVWTYALQILYLLVILMKVVVNCAMAGHGPAVLSPAGKGELNTWKRQGFFCQVPFETLGTSVSTWSIWNIQTKSHLNVSLSKCKVQYKFRGYMITINQ